MTGRLTASKAVAAGAASGRALRRLLATLLYWVVVGAGFGALFGLAGYAATGGRRDFTSVSGVEAARYEVAADPSVAVEARWGAAARHDRVARLADRRLIRVRVGPRTGGDGGGR